MHTISPSKSNRLQLIRNGETSFILQLERITRNMVIGSLLYGLLGTPPDYTSVQLSTETRTTASTLKIAYHFTNTPKSRSPNSNRDGSFLYEIQVAGERIHSIVNKQPSYFPNVKVYRSNPWNNAADAEVRNIIHRNLPHGM